MTATFFRLLARRDERAPAGPRIGR